MRKTGLAAPPRMERKHSLIGVIVLGGEGGRNWLLVWKKVQVFADGLKRAVQLGGPVQ